MGLSLEQRFERYCDGIVSTLLHADHEQPARWYIKGLMLRRRCSFSFVEYQQDEGDVVD